MFQLFGTAWDLVLPIAHGTWESRFSGKKATDILENRRDENLLWSGVVEQLSTNEIEKLYQEILKLPMEDPQMCNVCQTLWRHIYLEKCYLDCLHFVCLLANRIRVTKEWSDLWVSVLELSRRTRSKTITSKWWNAIQESQILLFSFYSFFVRSDATSTYLR